MSENQLSAFFEAVKADASLEAKLKDAADPNAAVAIARAAGFDVNKTDWLKGQARQALISDDELEAVFGGTGIQGSQQEKNLDPLAQPLLKSDKGGKATHIG